MKKQRLSIWKSKIDVVQSVVIAVLVVIIVLMNLPLVSQFLGKLNPLGPYEAKVREYGSRLNEASEQMRSQEMKNVALEYDRIRLEDSTNILLALQDYYFDRQTFPETLGQLREEGYIDALVRIEDPELQEPYFYRRLDGRFVLCIRLSDRIKGVNTQYCNPDELERLQQDGAKTFSGELKIRGDISVVNIRAEPNTMSKILYKARADEPFSYVEERDGWYKVVLDGTHGWVSAEFVTVQP
ncbi:SH3 domain-containing protein [Candidatus Uhrbacteria bacterium]|nr:MAG: SH3 domain-containing protein [Candidatus Uhrbacteria bacterium]